MIILVANTKGGVGKSTLAVHLAAHLSKKGKTLLIDTDKQSSAASWASWRRDKELKHNPRTVILFGDAVFKEGKVLATEHEHTVIDAGGRDSPSLRYAMLLADKLVVPMNHSDFDTSSWSDMLQIIEMAMPNNPDLKVQVVLSRIDGRRKPPRDVYDFLEEQGIQVCPVSIPERVSFVNATNEGLTVMEHGKDEKAQFAMKMFFKEVLNG